MPDLLHINRGRVTALEKLQKVEREKELLGARVAQLKAENEASMAECDLLRRKAKHLEVPMLVSGQQGQSQYPQSPLHENERLRVVL
jgi:hypothetical protein